MISSLGTWVFCVAWSFLGVALESWCRTVAWGFLHIWHFFFLLHCLTLWPFVRHAKQRHLDFVNIFLSSTAFLRNSWQFSRLIVPSQSAQWRGRVGRPLYSFSWAPLKVVEANVVPPLRFLSKFFLSPLVARFLRSERPFLQLLMPHAKRRDRLRLLQLLIGCSPWSL